MKKSTLAAWIGVSLLSTAGIAQAGEYIRLSEGDRAHYFQENSAVQSSMDMTVLATSGNWRKFSNFLGLQSPWVYSSPNSEATYMQLPGQKATLLVDFNNPVGTSYDYGMEMDCLGGATIGAKNETVLTDAGRFTKVVRLDFMNYCSDAGVNHAWFAPGAGLIKYVEGHLRGEVTSTLTGGTIAGQSYPVGYGLQLSADAPAHPIVQNGSTIKSVTTVLNLKNTSGEALPVRFDANPGYDMVLLRQGVEVNRWSNVRMQATSYAARSEILAAGGTLSQIMRLPLTDAFGAKLPNGMYTLRLMFTGTYAPEGNVYQPLPTTLDMPLHIGQ